MRIDRIDVPRRSVALELHPRMTVLVSPSAATRQVVTDTFSSIAGARGLSIGGAIEVNGVQLRLDDATIEQLQLVLAVSPIIRIGFGPTAPETAPGAAGAGGAPETADTAGLRSILRSLGAERAELDSSIDAQRELLDPFAVSAFEAAVGRVDALEARRRTARSEHERLAEDHAEGTGRRQLRADLFRWIADPSLADASDGLVGAAGELAEALGDLDLIDHRARRLAGDLDLAVATATELQSHRDQQLSRRVSLTAELAALEQQLRDAERELAAPVPDPEVVARLEAVRDEIFDADRRSARRRSSKQRVSELRAEEAVLLDQLGYDTYSSYVMGLRTVAEPPPELAADVAALRSAVSSASAGLAELERLESLDADVERAVTVVAALVREGHRLLGRDATTVPVELGDGAQTDVLDTAAIAELSESLRRQDTERTDALGSRIGSLLEQMRTIGAQTSAPEELSGAANLDLGIAWPPPKVAGTEAETLLEAVRQWVQWHRSAREQARAEVADGDPQRVAPTGDDLLNARAVWAEVEAELDRALDELSDCEERVRRHESATSSIAELREQQLGLRDNERSLLEQIAAAESAGVAAAVPTDSGSSSTVRSPGSAVGHVLSSAAGEWQVIETLALLRTASFVGSVPVLVDGLGDDPVQRRAVLDRLDALSDLFQVVVMTEDPAAVGIASSYGDRVLLV